MVTDQERAHTMDERETISYALTVLWDEGLIPREQMDKAEAWLDALRAENARLREALEPFAPTDALLIAGKSGAAQENAPLWYVGGIRQWVTVGDFLRVRKALAANAKDAPATPGRPLDMRVPSDARGREGE